MTIVAPTEPAQLKALGRVSLTPERFGADVLFASRLGTVGVQRKAMPGDFLASVTDGRLSKEVSQLQTLDLRVLVLEGRPTWTVDGELVNPWGQTWTRSQHRRFLWSMRLSGVWVEWSDDVRDTCAVIEDLRAWTAKAKHGSLMRRPGVKGAWGKPTSREWQTHLLESFDGVGADLAGRIIDKFGGAPLAWTVGVDDLMRVHGVGKVKARRMVGALEKTDKVDGAVA